MACDLRTVHRLIRLYEPACTAPDLNAKDVAAFPPHLQEKLNVAAKLLSQLEFEATLIPIREYDPTLADELAKLASGIRFCQVLDLLEGAKSDNE